MIDRPDTEGRCKMYVGADLDGSMWKNDIVEKWKWGNFCKNSFLSKYSSQNESRNHCFDQKWVKEPCKGKKSFKIVCDLFQNVIIWTDFYDK